MCECNLVDFERNLCTLNGMQLCQSYKTNMNTPKIDNHIKIHSPNIMWVPFFFFCQIISKSNNKFPLKRLIMLNSISRLIFIDNLGINKKRKRVKKKKKKKKSQNIQHIIILILNKIKKIILFMIIQIKNHHHHHHYHFNYHTSYHLVNQKYRRIKKN